MEKKRTLIFIGAAAAIIILFAGAASLNRLREKQLEGPAGGPDLGPAQVQESLTRAPVPEDVTVPEMEEEVTEGVAVPIYVAPASDSALTDAKSRSFSIVAENNKYSPNQIIVRHMDVVTIDFSAGGKAYDITIPDYGLKRVAAAGQTVKLQFQADQVGKFTFYCDLCGGLKSRVTGTITVAPKK